MGERDIAARVERIQKEIQGVASQYDVTSWERTFLDDIVERRSLSPKQEKILAEIEAKLFGEDGDG